MAGVPCMERLRMAHGLAGSEDWACKLGVRRGGAKHGAPCHKNFARGGVLCLACFLNGATM